jgi:hypothetical protein
MRWVASSGVESPSGTPGRPLGTRIRRRRLWITLSIVGALALCAVVPVRLLVLPLVIGTVTADRGEPSPTAALFAFVLTFEEPQQSVGVDRLIVAQRRSELGRQRRDYLQAMEADRKATGWSGRLEHAGQPTDTTSIEGDRATVVDSYGVRWTPPPQLRATPARSASVNSSSPTGPQ